MLRVGRHEDIFILFLLAIKIAGSAQKFRVGRVSGNTAIFCLRLTYKIPCIYDQQIETMDDVLNEYLIRIVANATTVVCGG